MSASVKGAGFLMPARANDLHDRLVRIEGQNRDLAQRLEEVERVLSQQNLVLEELMLELYGKLESQRAEGEAS